MKICEANDLSVIRYPRVAGSHAPLLVGQWISVIKSVQGFHANGIVHGDLRASNIVFSEVGNGATIIDFDFAGENDTKRYPEGFNVKIDDGTRARNASGGRPLLFNHDWFSVGSMMQKCVLEEENQSWNQACKLLLAADMSSERVTEVLSLLENCATIAVKSLKWTTDNTGTGSPERKK